MADALELEFEWDEQNVRHIQSHRISTRAAEQVIANDPLDLEYQVESGEERYKSLGLTDSGRLVVVVWTIRDDRIRVVTAYPAGKSLKKLYTEVRG